MKTIIGMMGLIATGLVGCASNPYNQFYRGEVLERPSQEVIWMEAHDIEQTAQELRAKGYLQIGSVAFKLYSSTWNHYQLDNEQATQWAIEQARHVGAELVVTCSIFGGSASSTYYEGSIGPYGFMSIYPMTYALTVKYYGATYWVKQTNPLAREHQGPQFARSPRQLAPFSPEHCFTLPIEVSPPEWHP